jgi:hypothetical protein
MSSRCSTVLVLILGLAFTVGPSTAAAASHRPSVTGFEFSPSAFAVAPDNAPAGSAARRATTIQFRLSRRATVRITLSRALPGRRSGGRCVKPTKRLSHRPACTRFLAVGKLRAARKAGRRTLAFSGRLRGHALRRGLYRATIVATTRHRSSKRRAARFTVTGVAGAPGPAPAPPAPPPTSWPPGGFPTPATTGVPAGWVPAQTRTTDLHVTQAGAVVQDVLLQNASIIVEAPNVTIRRVEIQGGGISNFNGSPCEPGMVIEDSSIEPPPGQDSSLETEGVIEVGGYTARRVKIWRRAEGFRSGADCGPIRVEDSFAKIVIPPGHCELHSDGIQGYHGPWTTIVNSTIDFREAMCGTAPFFFPKNQGNTGVTVDRLLVMGGGYPFRLGVPGTVSGLNIVDRSWGYGPINVLCSAVTSWDANIVTITADYQVAATLRRQPCNTQDGS